MEDSQNLNSVPATSYKLFSAVAFGKSNLVKQLLEQGAPANIYVSKENTPPEKIYKPDSSSGFGMYLNEGRTPLHYAAYPSGYASQQEDVEIASLLIEAGANVNAKDVEGRTPLYLAIQDRGNEEMVRYLVSKGANPNHRDRYNKRPIDVAEDNGNRTIVNVLLDYSTL